MAEAVYGAVVDRAILASLLVPTAFPAVHDADSIVAIAFGAMHRGFLVLEAVSTLQAFRGRG